MHDNADKKRININSEKLNKLVIKITSITVQILLIIGLIMVLIYTVTQTIESFQIGLVEVTAIILENSLLIIVFLEVYLSVVDFFHGKGRSVIYVMDATLSFILREIIIGILTGAINDVDLLAMSGAIGIIASGRFLLTNKNFIRRKTNKEKRRK
ncbi:phosphate-starvation-inducible PsiE family protein [Acidianus sp. HS-5]|uniref:phosphate-starvation-inducible PsiE family protein n=1 Tax=Acidianus sp. HS-5 TaxID=2886040 RepID=UPI001F4620B5|nr:phosphate-starvation-inducible PsiE family protein [Acidianus sp. HS-5]BDC17134.1 hypothetical protein HS5_00240 [Acidianus sp. HS-5]